MILGDKCGHLLYFIDHTDYYQICINKGTIKINP